MLGPDKMDDQNPAWISRGSLSESRRPLATGHVANQTGMTVSYNEITL